MPHKKNARLSAAIVAVLSMSSSAALFAQGLPNPLPPQPLVDALEAFSRQSPLQVVYSADVAKGVMSPGARAGQSDEETLRELLRDTGLTFEFVNERTVTVTRSKNHQASPARAADDRRTSAAKQARNEVRLASAESGAVSAENGVDTGTQGSGNDRGAVRLEEVVVTGSHIRGAQNFSSPVITFDREDIERSGYSTTQQLIQSLPQNLNNISDSTFSTVNGGQTGSYTGSGVNLRGLGGDATLVLVNGRRMAAAGNGAFVDISLIPLSAVERIDVLMDGASAIYGSDAVGGVVNISLKKHYSGAETGLRYGTVTEGNHHELQASQTIGVASDSGEVLVSYEYFRRSSLAGSDRTFVQPQPGLLDEIVLIPEQKRHSVLTVFSKKLNDSVELYGDAFYAERESQLNYQESGVPQIQMNDVGHYGASVGASIDLFRDWSAHASLSVNEIESKSRTVGMPGAVLQYKTNNESRLITAEFTAEGTVLEIPAGDVQLAIGAQFRDDRFVEGNDLYPARLARDVSAVYAELLLPVVGEAGMQGGNRLEMSLAGRFEQYSDFGSTFNPKLGVSWRPMDGLNVRGSWGTSFKAPLLSQMNPGDLWVGVEVDRYRDSAGPVTAITLTGAGERLGAEESENLTVGFDLSSPSHPHMTLSATYFDTEYEDRIRTPLPSGYDAHGSILQDQAYADLITRNPSGDRVSELMSHPKAYCYTQTALCAAWPQAEDVIAIVDRRLRNIAGLRTKGMDITATYQWKTDWGNWQAQVGGTNYFEYRERHAPGAAEVDAMNDVWRPVDLRMRAGLSFSRGAFDAASFVNYADSYRDTRGANWTGATPKRSSVSSWTTVDLTLRYVLGNLFASGGNGKSTLALSATNIFDKDPPYVASYAGLFFDGVNASPLGRFISVQLNVQL